MRCSTWALRAIPVIDDLMLTPGINLVDFTQAQAYSRQFRFLSVVTLPRGLINLDKDVPNHDYHLVAPAAALVARANLHPALVDLFVAAATNLHGQGQDFERPGEFPSDLHLDFPLSKEAARVLANGPSFLRRYLPFWVAVFVERTWILILPLHHHHDPAAAHRTARLSLADPAQDPAPVSRAARHRGQGKAGARSRANARCCWKRWKSCGAMRRNCTCRWDSRAISINYARTSTT